MTWLALLLSLCFTCFAQSSGLVEAPNNDVVSSALTWGPYRPNLYFGMRPRVTEDLLLGLMWGTKNHDGIIQRELI